MSLKPNYIDISYCLNTFKITKITLKATLETFKSIGNESFVRADLKSLANKVSSMNYNFMFNLLANMWRIDTFSEF